MSIKLGKQLQQAQYQQRLEEIRADFPILDRDVNDKPLVYLDNAATSQKPLPVIEALDQFYAFQNSNIHRGVYQLSQEATVQYEDARQKVADSLNASKEEEIVFTKGTTEAINLVAQSYGRMVLKAGDEVLLTGMEHHANIVPWQMICQSTGANLKYIPCKADGSLDLGTFDSLLTTRTKIVSIAHVSNVLGTVNPVKEMIAKAHAKGAVVLLDGAQAVSHMKVDVQDLDADFYVFSGHKVYGPTGIGVLYGKEALLKDMPPYQGGGNMIVEVGLDKSTYKEAPYKFEAGTPPIADAVALGAALDYIEELGWDFIQGWEAQLRDYAVSQLSSITGLKILGHGNGVESTSVISFSIEGVHPHDIGTILDQEGVAVRTGHHCAQPLMKKFGIPACTRASFAIYNTKEEVDQLVAALGKVKTMFHLD